MSYINLTYTYKRNPSFKLKEESSYIPLDSKITSYVYLTLYK